MFLGAMEIARTGKSVATSAMIIQMSPELKTCLIGRSKVNGGSIAITEDSISK
jgi:hypothetical protein